MYAMCRTMSVFILRRRERDGPCGGAVVPVEEAPRPARLGRLLLVAAEPPAVAVAVGAALAPTAVRGQAATQLPWCVAERGRLGNLG